MVLFFFFLFQQHRADIRRIYAVIVCCTMQRRATLEQTGMATGDEMTTTVGKKLYNYLEVG